MGVPRVTTHDKESVSTSQESFRSYIETRPFTRCLKTEVESLTVSSFRKRLDSLLRRFASGAFKLANANEGSVWFPDEKKEKLLVAWNSGSQARSLEQHAHQPLSAGLISAVYNDGRSVHENNVKTSGLHSQWIDIYLGQETLSLMARPLYLAGVCAGVVSCVQLESRSRRQSGFKPSEQEEFGQFCVLLGRLLEWNLILSEILGKLKP